MMVWNLQKENNMEDDNKQIKWLIDNFLKGKWPIPQTKDIEYMMDIGKMLDTNFERYKRDVELDYIKRLMLKLERSKSLKERLSIYKFVYLSLPYKKFVGFVTGSKFRLFDVLPKKERNIAPVSKEYYF